MDLDPDELLDGLAPGLNPERLPDRDRAASVLPVFTLMRSLFSTSPADTMLKMVVLLALARVEGRFSRERIRTLVPMLDDRKLESVVTSLYQGGWLQLRKQDHTYRIAPIGLFLLSVLLAADFSGQDGTNLLIRAAETVAFGDRVEGDSTGHLLAVLLGELETQASTAREILGRGTPRQLIRFSRQRVREQIATVVEVLATIEQRMDASSEHFGRIVRIHESLQEILRAHEGLAQRLTEWHLKRLETSEAGYSIAALSDAIMGATDAELTEALDAGIVRPLSPALCLVTEQLLTRHSTTRPSMKAERDAFVYAHPPDPEIEPLALEDIDPIARLKARLAAALAEGREPTRAVLEDSADFGHAVYLLGLIARMEGREGDRIELAPGVVIRLSSPGFDPEQVAGLGATEAIAELVRQGVIIHVPGLGDHSRIEVQP